MTTHTAEKPRTRLVTHQLHVEELRRRAAQLREQAEQAREHAFAVLATTELRRRASGQTTEQAEFDAEQALGAQELEAYITGLRREQELLRAEAALQQEWFREQALSALGQGWSRRELAEIGFGDEFLADLGLLDHPGLRPG